MNSIRTLSALGVLAGAAALAAVSGSATPTPAPVGQAPLFEDGSYCVSNKIASALFAEGTDPAVIAKVYNMILKPLEDAQSRYYTGSRWPVGTTGNPVSVTYSFPSDGLSLDQGGGNPNVLHADLTGIFGSEAAWKDLFRTAFDQWELFTGNTYTEVPDDNSFWGSSGPIHGGSGRGDIRIWSYFVDGGSNTLAFNFFPGSGTGGDMVLDSSENWGSGPSSNFRFFRNVITHENGHGMGIFHVCTDSGHRALMNPFASTAFDGPQHDDIRAMQRLYGDYNEPNNNTGAATDLGALVDVDSASLFGISISGGEDDYYEITLSSGAMIDVTVTPTGQTYNMAQQNGNGSCSIGPEFNSLDQHDLRITVLNSTGFEIASEDSNPAGLPEFLEDLTVGASGSYYVVVDSASSFNSQTQLYNITINSSIALPAGDVNGDCVVDTADLGALIGTFGTAGPLGDINNDGLVDTADLGILIGNFGTTCDDL